MKILITLCFALSVFAAQLGPCKHTTPDMITQILPNYTGSIQPCSYSGFAPLDPENVSALFYWYFPHQSPVPDSEVPLILWLQGGPGTSDMFGLFLENGPFQIVSDSESDGGHNVNYRDEDGGNSWAYYYNVLYVDQPISVGFSYTTNYSLFPTDETQVSEQLWTGLQFFLNLHPETQGLKWYVAGESFGGRYVPAIANYTLIANDLIANNTIKGIPINIQGIMVGDGLVNTFAQRTAAVYASYSSSLIAPYMFEQLITYSVNCQLLQYVNQTSALAECNNLYSYVSNVSGINPYTISLPLNITNNLTANIPLYLNNEDVYQVLGVTSSPYTPAFNMSSANISASLATDFLIGTSLYEIEYLLTRIQVLWYDGGYDERLGALGSYYWFPLLSPPYNQILNTSREIWKPDGQNAGMYTQLGNLTFLIVNWAGHFVPYFQLKTSVQMVQTFTMLNNNWTALQNVTSVPMKEIMCEAMNNCNGNGFCSAVGTCICNPGWGLADCSIQAQPLNGTMFTLNPRDFMFVSITYSLIDHIYQISGDDGLLEIYFTNHGTGPALDASEADLWYNSNKGLNKTRMLYLYKGKQPTGYLTLHNSAYDQAVTFQIKKDTAMEEELWSQELQEMLNIEI